MVDELVVVRRTKAPEAVCIARPPVLGRQRGEQVVGPVFYRGLTADQFLRR